MLRFQRTFIWSIICILILAASFLPRWKNGAIKPSPEIRSAPENKDVEPNRLIVTRIVDGDTLVVRMQTGETTVRLLGVDCPERDQPFGSQATAILHRLTDGQTVEVRSTGKDRYGRVLAHLHTSKGAWINLGMVEQGAAWTYRAKRDEYWAELKEAERKAREDRRGLWAGENPIYPGDWRK
jgi:micrococcal nuclease